MKYYVSMTTVNWDGNIKNISGYESPLTKPDTYKATSNSLRRMRAIGIENLHLCEHPTNSRRYGTLLRADNKRHKERKMTKADVAEIFVEFEKDQETSEKIE
jgi:hypothetical protein